MNSETRMNLLTNQYLLAIVACAIGILLGIFLLKPLFKGLKNFVSKRKLHYLAVLFSSLAKISFIIGGIVFLNLTGFLPDGIFFGPWLGKLKIGLNVFVVTYILAEALVFIYDGYTKAKMGKATSLYHIIIRILTYIAGTIVLTNLIGFELAPILTALGVGGLAVALALQDTLSNLFAGLHILAAKQLKPGDYIQLDAGVEGYVLDINWRNTEIVTLLENVIIIPNSKISSSITTNFFSLQKNLFFQVAVGVHYDSDLERVEEITLDTARVLLAEYPPLPQSFEPKVRFYEFAESSVNMKVWLATDLYENQYEMMHKFVKRLHKRFNDEGIIIPFPIRTVYMKNQD